jgi:hypothetical protein
MKEGRILPTILILVLLVMSLSCGIGRMIWPQRDIQTYELTSQSAEMVVP